MPPASVVANPPTGGAARLTWDLRPSLRAAVRGDTVVDMEETTGGAAAVFTLGVLCSLGDVDVAEDGAAAGGGSACWSDWLLAGGGGLAGTGGGGGRRGGCCFCPPLPPGLLLLEAVDDMFRSLALV